MVAFISSPIDTLLQPATRARAPSRTCTAVPSQPFKSNPRCDLRETNLTTDTRWGSRSRDPVGYAEASSAYLYVRGRATVYVDPSGNVERFPEPPTCGDACCCCPQSLTASVAVDGYMEGGIGNHRVGRKLTVTASMTYGQTNKRLPGWRHAHDCSLLWYEWSSYGIWYAPGVLSTWINSSDYPETAKSEVFKEWLSKERPQKCPPVKTLSIKFPDSPEISNANAGTTATGYIAIRLRGGGDWCSPACKTNDLYLIAFITWPGNGVHPKIVTSSNPATLTPNPGLPFPHF